MCDALVPRGVIEAGELVDWQGVDVRAQAEHERPGPDVDVCTGVLELLWLKACTCQVVEKGGGRAVLDVPELRLRVYRPAQRTRPGLNGRDRRSGRRDLDR